MDPNAVLRKCRKAVERINRTSGSDVEAVVELVDSFQVLDKWLSADGFLPKAWRGDS